jgi:hypothetical protein
MKTKDIIDKFKDKYPRVKNWKRVCKFALPSRRILRVFVDKDEQYDGAVMISFQKDNEVESYDLDQSAHLKTLSTQLTDKMGSESDLKLAVDNFFLVLRESPLVLEEAMLSCILPRYAYSKYPETLSKELSKDISSFLERKDLIFEEDGASMTIELANPGDAFGDCAFRFEISQFGDKWDVDIIDD